MPRSLAAEQLAGLEMIIMREDRIGLLGVAHILLDPEIGDPGVEVQRAAHGDGRQVGGAVAAGADLVQRGEVGNAAQVRDAARTHDGAADEVDQLVLDQVLGVPDRVEDLAHSQRRRRMLANQLECLLVFGRRAILKPEQLIGLEHLAEVGGLHRGIAMMAVVQQMMVEAIGRAQLVEQFRHVVQRLARVPAGYRRQGCIRWLIMERAPADAIGVLNARHAALRADRLVAHLDILADGIDRFLNVTAVGMAIDHDPVATAPAEQLVQGHPGHLGLDVPQGHVDGCNRAHRDRATPPIGALVQILPDILDLARIHADQARDHMIFEIGHDR